MHSSKLIIPLITLFASFATAEDVQIDMQWLHDETVYVGSSNAAIRIVNHRKEDVSYRIRFHQRGCKALIPGAKNIYETRLYPIDYQGVLRSNDFMISILPFWRYKVSKLCVFYVDVNVDSEQFSTTKQFKLAPQQNEDYFITFDTWKGGDESAWNVDASLKPIKDDRYLLDILIENSAPRSLLFWVLRREIKCRVGDAYIDLSDDYIDGVANGLRGVMAGEWTAFKTVIRAQPKIDCEYQMLVSDLGGKSGNKATISIPIVLPGS